jgi:membrane-bound metal-dependent hydrolase YbcI (DUF457 family)
VVAALQPNFSLNRDWKPLLLGALLGICPDLDFFIFLIPGSGRGWHHGFTHSVVFAFLVGLSTSFVVGQMSLDKVLMWSLATLSHPLLDFLITEAGGVELFWPFSTRRFKLSLPNPIDYSWRNISMWDTFLDLLKICLIEFIIFAPIFLLVLWIRQATGRRAVSD